MRTSGIENCGRSFHAWKNPDRKCFRDKHSIPACLTYPRSIRFRLLIFGALTNARACGPHDPHHSTLINTTMILLLSFLFSFPLLSFFYSIFLFSLLFPSI